jgi:hypothetical protein
MPAADVQYVLDGAVECGHIGGDTHFFFMELAPNANELFDSCGADRPTTAPRDGDSYWKSLTDMGLSFERAYVNWRSDRPLDMHLASFQGLRAIPHVFREMSRTAASHIVENNFGGWTPSAIEHLDHRFDMTRSLQIMRRTMHRAASDFSGADANDMQIMHQRVTARYEANRAAYNETIARIRAEMHGRDVEWTDVPYERERDVKSTQALIRERVKEERRIIKRSVKFLNRLMGENTTRMFIGGDRIRVEGQHAIYEIGKESNLMQSHGGFRALSVFDKENPDLLLCQLCINTPGVPLLDHVASLVMHIRSGEEDQILSIGNASNINDAAYDRLWLAPHLPVKRQIDFDINLFPWDRDLDPLERAEKRMIYHRKVEEMVKVTSKHIFEEVLADFVPLLTKSRLRFGTRSLDYIAG